ncbi:hypothetical protein ACIQBJ_32165 [Kitasatospora sp. NPDC088391]|uniref:hypothetical protein n=1 Tax=Kitasatospora sp. NPDC088391 TaxID=3364074 RepID=UPI0038000947
MTVRARQTALRAAALTAAALLLTACNDDDPAVTAANTAAASHPAAAPSASATGKAKEPANGGRSSAKPTAGAAADATAQARTGKLALTAKDWDHGFVADGDDDTDRSDYTMDKSCRSTANGGTVKGMTATTSRFVRQDHESDTTFANTEVSVFSGADAAHQDIAEYKANIARCENYTDAESHNAFSTAHEAESPTVPGADEVYTEEGLGVYDTTEGGRTDKRPYTYIIARKGAVTISVFVDGDPQRQSFEGRGLAREALAKLAARW